MEEKVLREQVTLERLAAEMNEQALVEGEVALPGGIREEATVLSCEARLSLSGVESQADRLTMDGNVIFEVLYLQGGDAIRVLEANCAFAHVSELSGVDARMRPQVYGAVSGATAEAAGGRLRLRAALDLSARVFDAAQVSLVTGMRGVDGLQSDSVTTELARHAASGRATTLLREEFELTAPPEIAETLYARAMPRVQSVSGGEGRAMVEGEVALEVLHAGADAERPLVVTRHAFPFEQAVEMDGASAILRASARVQDVAVSSVDVGDGVRVLRTETVLNIEADGYEPQTLTCLRDAYTLGGDELELSITPVSCFTGIETPDASETDKLVVSLGEDARPIRRTLTAILTPTLISMEPASGRTVAEGLLDAQIIYLPRDGTAPVSARRELPFRIAFDEEIPVGAQVRLSARDVQTEGVDERRVEIKYRMELNAVSVGARELALPTGAVERPAARRRSGLVVVWPQPGETRWDIAKRLRVTTAGIARLNPESENVKPGRGILIYRR